MNGPSLPNPFDMYPTENGRLHGEHAGGSSTETRLDAAIAEALRSEPLAPPPPLLYAAVMRSVRADVRPRFHIHWLDLALSLFAAGMLLTAWWALRSLPQVWLDYMRLEVMYQVNKLWYLNFPLVVWSAAAFAMLLACIAAAWLARPQRSDG